MSSNATRGLGRWIVIGLGGFVFAVFAAVIWYAYVEVMGLGAGGPPPLVRAEAGPIKRSPDDPGGMEIPNRDSAVARVFEDNTDGIRRERILPRQDTTPVPPEPEPEPAPAPPPAAGAPAGEAQAAIPTQPAPATPDPPVEQLTARESETPIRPPAATATRPAIAVTDRPPPTAPAQPTVPPPRTQAAAPAPRVPPRPLTPPATAQPAPRATPTPVVPPAAPSPPQQTAARTPPAATPPARSAPAASPIYRVQLGAFRSDAAANQAWTGLQNRLGGALSGLRPTVLEAVTSAGTFYRLQAGPLPNRDGAVQTCAAVKAGGNDCFIVGPLP